VTTPHDQSPYRPFVELYRSQTELLDTLPDATNELLDFHYKHRLDDYRSAIEAFPGRTLFLAAASEMEAAALIRRSLLISDLLLFSVDSYIGRPRLGLLPISDEVASPVLGLGSAINAQTGQNFVPTASAWYQAMALHMLSAKDRGESADLLGTSWSASDSPEWERTMFVRLADELRDVHGSPCHVAGGLIHFQRPEGESLLTDAASLMRRGKLAYTPFVVGNVASAPEEHLLLKAAFLGSEFASGMPQQHLQTVVETTLLQLDLPYLEGASFQILSKVMEEEQDSIHSFRCQFDRLVEDVTASEDLAETRKLVIAFKRDILEDEVERVRQVLARASKMKSMVSAGTFVGVAGVSLAATQGLPLSALMTGLSGTLAASLTAWYRAHLEACEARHSPAHLLWRFQRRG
jgi:hypothetical protein